MRVVNCSVEEFADVESRQLSADQWQLLCGACRCVALVMAGSYWPIVSDWYSLRQIFPCLLPTRQVGPQSYHFFSPFEQSLFFTIPLWGPSSFFVNWYLKICTYFHSDFKNFLGCKPSTAQGKVATVYRWGGPMYTLLMSNFLRIWHTKNH